MTFKLSIETDENRGVDIETWTCSDCGREFTFVGSGDAPCSCPCEYENEEE
jgi:hypothetical protein